MAFDIPDRMTHREAIDLALNALKSGGAGAETAQVFATLALGLSISESLGAEVTRLRTIVNTLADVAEQKGEPDLAEAVRNAAKSGLERERPEHVK